MGVTLGVIKIGDNDIKCIKSFLSIGNKKIIIYKHDNFYSISIMDESLFRFIPMNEWNKYLTEDDLYYMEILLCLIIEEKLIITDHNFTAEEINELIEIEYPIKQKNKKALEHINLLKE